MRCKNSSIIITLALLVSISQSVIPPPKGGGELLGEPCSAKSQNRSAMKHTWKRKIHREVLWSVIVQASKIMARETLHSLSGST